MSGILMLWKGIEGDQRLFWASTTDEADFDGPHFRGDLNSSQGPALTVFNGRVFMGFKGVQEDPDQLLFLASGPVSEHGIDPNTFTGPLNRSDQKTSKGPALTVFRSRLFMIWKGVEGDQHVFVASSPDDNSFDAPHRLPEAFLTSQRPAVTVFNGKLFMAWRGVQDDPQQHLFLSSSLDGVNFDGPHMLLGLNSSHGPSLTVFNNRLFIAFKGSGGDQRLFLASSPDGVKFDGPHSRVDQITSQGPALTAFNQRLFIAWKNEGDQLGGPGLRWASTPNGTDFDSPHRNDAFNSSQGPALTVF